MMHKLSVRSSLYTATALTGVFFATPAMADCVSQAPVNPNQVVCDNPGNAGWNGSATNGIVVTVAAGSTTTTNVGGPAVISAGTNSAVINFSGVFAPPAAPTFGIDAGSSSAAAISVGAGSIVTNTSGAAIQGTVTFGNATGTTTSTLNNNYSSIGATNKIGLIDGAITAAGNFTFNNSGFVGWTTNAGVTQTGPGAVVINNGIDGGYASSVAGSFTYKNAFIWNGGSTVISTVGNTNLINHGGGTILGSLLQGNVVIGTGGTGTSSITNGSQAFGNATINGSVTMGDKNNTITNDGTITGNVTMNGTGSNTYNAGSTGSSGDNGLRLPGAAITAGTGAPTGVVTGTLTGLAANSANNTLNLNGVGASTLQAGSSILNFGVVNKNDGGSWLLKNTLDGAAGKLTNVNVTGGTLATDNAAFLGSSATTVKLSNGTTLNFNGTAAGTFAGNIVDATGATTGVVTVTGPSTTTLSGSNSYSGATTINGGTLATGSNGALSANSDFTIQNGGTLIVNNNVALKSLADAGTGPNTVNLNGAGTSLGLTSGSFGANGGTIIGTGTLIKSGTGTFSLNGANTVNLTAPGTFQINNGVVNVAIANAIGSTTAVQVNSTATTTGVLNVNFSDTIGSLAGTGANAQVNLATGVVLNTGGLNSSTTFAGKIAGAGALVKSGTGAMTLTGSNTYSGGTTINGGSIIGYAGSTATNGSLQGNINIASGASLGFDQTLSPNGNTSGTYAGQLSGAGFVTFLGNGTGVLTLSGNNTGLTGQMNFYNNSIVAISSANNLGVSNLDFANGTLETTATMTLANTISLSGPKGTFQVDAGTTTLNGGVSGTGQLIKTGTGTLVLGAPSSYTGGTLVSAGILQGSAGSSIQGNIVNNAEVDLTGTTQSYVGNMSGTGKVRVINNAVIAMNGVNTYSGTTTIDAGSELYSFTNTGLSANSAFVVNGILGPGGSDPTNVSTIGSLAGTGLVVAPGTLNIGNDNTSTTFSGKFGTGGFFVAATKNINKIGTGTLTLSGTGSVLTGNLGVNAGTLSLTGTLAAATTTVASGAILSVDGTLTSPTVTVASGGRLVGGLGTTPGNIVGSVTNNGTIAPGHSPGILAINGSYTQTSTGTYAADVLGNGTTTVVAGTDFDRIAVTGAPGTATLAGTLAITQNTGSLYVAGTTYDIITTTGGITGNFTSVTGNTISTFLSLSNTVANGGGIVGNNYRLVVVRSAYNTAAANPNQVAVANGLTGIIGSSGASATINKIDNMSSAQAQALFQGLNPEPYAAYATSLQDQGELFTRQVAGRMAEGAEAKTGIWMNAYGSWGNGKSSDYRFGSDHKVVGGAVGLDFATGGMRVGLAGGYSEDKVTYLGANSEGKDKSWQVGGYIFYGSGPLHFDAQVAYITGNITATKLVNAGSGATLISGTAGVDTNGHLFKGIATVGYNVGGEKLKFEPYVGIDFTSGHINGFTETGLGTLNLTVANIEAKRTDLVVGARFAAPTGSITPYANVTYRYNLNDNPAVVSGYFNGVSTAPFTVSAIGSGRSSFDVDAGISAKIGTGASVFVGYQGTFRNDLNSHGVNGGVRISF